MLGKGFFLTESHNPDLPPEEWTLVYEKTTAGAYSENLGWGKYKVVISGGGGSGAAMVREILAKDMQFRYCENGYAGQEQTVLLDVLLNETKTFSGTVGSGASGSRVYYDGVWAKATYGAVGTGYANGAIANTKYEFISQGNSGAWVGGSGGGSTSISVDGVLNTIANGGNGGGAQVNYNGYKTSTGGTGGGGGTTSGTGASGGANVSKQANSGSWTSGAGTDGYIRIYKSNLKPEPI